MKAESLTASLFAIGIALAASTAGAQEPAPQQGVNSDQDIVVTARRRDERIQDVPVAITAFSGEKLEQLGVKQTADLRFVTPGLNVQGAAGREENPTYLLRGQRANDTLLTQDGAVASYIDDVVIGATPGSNLGLFDLESVQILKGPQGTLFGRNTTGGAILFRTAQPSDKFEARLTGSLGNYDYRGLQGMINLPQSEELQLRAAFNYVNRDGFAKIVEGPRSGDRLQGREELSGRLTIAFQPGDTFKSTTTLFGSRSDSDGGAFILTAINPLSAVPLVPGSLAALTRQQARGIRENGAQYRTGTRIRLWGIYNTSTLELNDTTTFKNIIAYRHMNYSSFDDFDGTSLNIGPQSGNAENARQFTEEAQILGTAFNDTVNYVVGLYYFKMHGVDEGDSVSLAPINPSSPSHLGGDYRNESFSGYGQVTVKTPVENLSVTAGLRYTVDRRYVNLSPRTLPGARVGEVCNLSQPGVVYTLANCSRSESTSFTKPTWTLSADYKLDADTLLYVAHRRGYRSGGFNARAATDVQFEPFQPETVSDIELGVKKDFRFDGWSLRTNIAVYNQWYKDVQKNVNFFTNSVLQSGIINAASATIKGGEAEINIDIGRYFSAGLGYSYVKPKYNSFATIDTVGGVPSQIADRSDRIFASVPRHQLSANIRVGLPVDESVGRIDFSASYFYQSSIVFSEQFQTPAQLREKYAPAQQALILDSLGGFGQKGYGLLNLRLDWADIAQSPVSAAIIAKNVTKKDYFAAGISIMDSLGTNAGVAGDPRTVMAELTVKF